MKTTLYYFLFVLVTGLVSILLFPHYTVNPGVLIEDHLYLQNDCLACHSLGKGALTEKCINCHKPDEIGLFKAGGSLPELQNKKSNLLHQSIINIQCYDCHTEHNGLSRENATLNFKHTVLSDNLQRQCTSCHIKMAPDNSLHNVLTASTQCAQCHTTTKWKPSTFNHTEFFKFDKNHPSDCSGCHDLQKGFKEYTCYNCHEHTQSRVAKKHRKKGIRNFENCVNCHRTGDKKDAKRLRNRERDED